MNYNLSDNVLARIVQIVQEGMLLGIDVVDIMRLIEVTPSSDGAILELTEEYVKKVTAHHEQLLREASVLRDAKSTGFSAGLFIDGEN